MGIHIHIGGPVRTGKTTLAKNLAALICKETGEYAALIDVDHTRTITFGADEPILGTLDLERDKEKFDLQKKMQGWSYNNVFEIQIPLVASVGAIPIFTATHASLLAYDRAAAVAAKMGNQLRFILLGDVPFEEMVRRCQSDNQSKSDMRDPINNETERKNYEDIMRRIHASYDSFDKPIFRLPQGTPEAMARKALDYVAEG